MNTPLNTHLSSKCYASRRAALGNCLVAFDEQGQCLGVVKREGVVLESPEPINDDVLRAAQKHPRHFAVSEEWQDPTKAEDSISKPESTTGEPVTGEPVTGEHAVEDVEEVAGKAVVNKPTSDKKSRPRKSKVGTQANATSPDTKAPVAETPAMDDSVAEVTTDGATEVTTESTPENAPA